MLNFEKASEVPVTVDQEKQRKMRLIELATELSEVEGGLSFPGIDSTGYAKLKTDEDVYPGCATPIDELIQRFSGEGVKIAFGKDPGNIYILPCGSDDIENDSVFPRYLDMRDDMDPRLRELILLNRAK